MCFLSYSRALSSKTILFLIINPAILFINVQSISPSNTNRNVNKKVSAVGKFLPLSETVQNKYGTDLPSAGVIRQKKTRKSCTIINVVTENFLMINNATLRFHILMQ